MGDIIKEETLKAADCPVDSIILRKPDEPSRRDGYRIIKEEIEKLRTRMGAGECCFLRPEDIKWSKLGKADLQKDFSDAHRFDIEHYMSGQEIIRAYLDGIWKCNLCFDFENRN